MRKICIVTANRAEYSRIKTVIQEILKHPKLELKLVVAGSHLLEKYGNTIEEVKADGFTVDHQIYVELDGNNPCTMAKSIGIAVSDLATYFDNTKTDIVVAIGDRYEILAVAIAASVMNISVAHVQGGEITGTIDESIRHAITKLAHIHFPATEKSRERIIRMGERPDRVFNVGCPGTDLLLETPYSSYEETIARVNALNKTTDARLDPHKPLVIVMQFPVTTECKRSFDQIQETIFALQRIRDRQILMFWPNIDAGSTDIVRAMRHFQSTSEMADNVYVVKHAAHKIFINLLRHAECFIGNSSSGIRETCYFGTPTIDIGTRQQNRERGKNVINVSYDRDAIYKAFLQQKEHGRYEPEYLFGNGQAGKKIADIMAEIDLSQIQKRNAY